MPCRLRYVAVASLLLVGACEPSNDFVTRHAQTFDPEGRISSGLSAEIRSDTYVANAWTRLVEEAIAQNGVGPAVGGRALAYAAVALYEAMAQGNPQLHSLAGQLNGFSGVPAPEPGRAYVWPLVADIAMHFVVSDLFNEGMAAGGFVQMAVLRHQIQDHYQALAPDQEAFRRSIEHGEVLGRAITQWALRDGYRQAKDCAYDPPPAPGNWEPTPPDFDDAFEPCFGQLRPMILSSPEECQPPPPPAFSGDSGSRLRGEMMEVYETVNSLTPNELAIAEFWADDPGTTPTASGHFFAIARELVDQERLDLVEASIVYAKLGVSQFDAFVSAWRTKYRYNTLRPITYVREFVRDGWESAVLTPPFPDYTSGHAVTSGAASVVMESLFGNIGFVDNTYSNVGLPPRRFNNFTEAANESAASRVFGGVHYRASVDEGLRQGRCIGNKVNTLRFR